MAGIDINRSTSGVLLPPEVSGEIWSNAITESAVMQLSRQITLPGSGVSIPIITGDAEADWVAETAEKPVSRATLGNKLITPYKLAVIEPFSNEFRRDLPGLYAELARRLPSALARKFDSTVLAGAAPGSNFDVLTGAAAVGISGDTYGGLVAADQAVATGGGLLNGWALSPQARGLLLGAVDAQGRPLFINNVQTDGAVPALLGAPVYTSKAVYLADIDGAGVGTDSQLGYAGDWTSAMFGTVEGVQISVSDQATINDGGTQLNLWQRDMFAIRAEIEIGFRVRDIAHFAKLTNATQA
ncbi:phage major capsid protein [Arthrobacter roseus]|uniref:phage major capsid protein n=1 Tax=Arthrobacter roseus TaxID=136274 RepID=UPI001965D8D0|nr:phage major capsid protein [Arthrobacter roseus]MBM7847467.1 HK97 family phage major capsid protein [Arthrobacter roseus]